MFGHPAALLGGFGCRLHGEDLEEAEGIVLLCFVDEVLVVAADSVAMVNLLTLFHISYYNKAELLGGREEWGKWMRFEWVDEMRV
jgi:hypothetical protein